MKSKNIKQTDLAHVLGVTQQCVSRWVVGLSKPRLEEVVKLANILDVSIEDIVFCFVQEVN